MSFYGTRCSKVIFGLILGSPLVPLPKKAIPQNVFLSFSVLGGRERGFEQSTVGVMMTL